MSKLRVINVLSKDTYDDCHIAGSIHVPYDDLAEYSRGLDKDTEIIVYCASYMCPMSKRAWQLLKDQGFTNVRAYEGGTSEWYSLGYPTEGPAMLQYLQESYDKPLEHGDVETITAEELKEKISF